MFLRSHDRQPEGRRRRLGQQSLFSQTCVFFSYNSNCGSNTWITSYIPSVNSKRFPPLFCTKVLSQNAWSARFPKVLRFSLFCRSLIRVCNWKESGNHCFFPRGGRIKELFIFPDSVPRKAWRRQIAQIEIPEYLEYLSFLQVTEGFSVK